MHQFEKIVWKHEKFKYASTKAAFNNYVDQILTPSPPFVVKFLKTSSPLGPNLLFLTVRGTIYDIKRTELISFFTWKKVTDLGCSFCGEEFKVHILWEGRKIYELYHETGIERSRCFRSQRSQRKNKVC